MRKALRGKSTITCRVLHRLALIGEIRSISRRERRGFRRISFSVFCMEGFARPRFCAGGLVKTMHADPTRLKKTQTKLNAALDITPIRGDIINM